MSVSFEGRVAVVTGAGGGLGRAYARELATRGARVVVNDFSADAAEAVVKEIETDGGTAVAAVQDVGTPKGGAAVTATALDTWGRVDVVINNAGVLRDRSFAKLSDDELETVLSVHLRGAFYVSRPAFAAMKVQGYGRFVFTASNSGVFGNFGQTNYGAAKMGLVGLSNVLAVEGQRAGILSNVIMPMAATGMTADTLGEVDGVDLAEVLDPALVAPMVVYLASENCTTTHSIYSAGAGRYSRVFIGLTPGWYAGGGATPTAEDVEARLASIDNPEGYIVPLCNADEVSALLAQIRA